MSVEFGIGWRARAMRGRAECVDGRAVRDERAKRDARPTTLPPPAHARAAPRRAAPQDCRAL
ncbi:hypothetical protein WS62_28820 [Burkholderia sp. ABCPW 14]|nr:hypothetical protein WS62_28820 [Burkholderia sp. ABCPW 14]